MDDVVVAVLRARRADLNQRFKHAQQQYRNLAADDWLAYVRDTLVPVAQAVAAVEVDRVPLVLDTLYEQGLPLVAQHWLGRAAREPVLPSAYRQLLIALARALARDPARLSGALLNALYQISAQDAARAQGWADSLCHLGAALTDVDAVLALGTLLAWRAGLPAYRAAALRAGAALPPALAQAALDLPHAPTATLWAALTQAPTQRADEVGVANTATVEWLGWVGGYRALGGPFAEQPTLGLAGGKLAASDGTHTWWLAADGYGVQAVRMGASVDWPLQTVLSRVQVFADGVVAFDKQVLPVAALASANARVWYAGVLAVTLATSYQVALLRVRLP